MNVASLYPNATLNSSEFTFHNNVFAAEMSIIGRDFRFLADENGHPKFYIQSAKTGEIRGFVFLIAERDNENEMTALLFRCCDPGYRHLEARLFND